MSRRPPSRQPMEDGLTCPRCDALAAWNARYCGECGARLGLTVDNSVEGGENEPSSPWQYITVPEKPPIVLRPKVVPIRKENEGKRA